MNLLSRLIDIGLSLPTLFVLGTVLGTALLVCGKARAGRRILLGLSALGLGLMIFPADVSVAQRLEDRFPQPRLDHVDGIVVLGGAVNMSVSLSRDQPVLNQFAERDTELIALMQRFPKAKILFSGGAANPFDQQHKEAEITRRWLDHMGVDTSRIQFEDQSRNTHENAVFSKTLAQPLPGETWLLVTSAIHMPRSVGCFRAVDWPVTAWPVNYLTQAQGRIGSAFHLFTARRLMLSSVSLHELIGLVFYRLEGWTPTLFPSP